MSPSRFQLCLTIVLVCSISWFSSNLLNIFPPILFFYFFFHTSTLHSTSLLQFPLFVSSLLLLQFIILILILFFLSLCSSFHPPFYTFSTFPAFLLHFFSFITSSHFFPSTSSSSNHLPYYFSRNLSVHILPLLFHFLPLLYSLSSSLPQL